MSISPQVQTQNREKLAEPQLPPKSSASGITMRKCPRSPGGAHTGVNRSAPRRIFLANYAILRVLDNLKRLPGVGDALVFGAQNYTMRLILDPVRMAQLALTPSDIANVVGNRIAIFRPGRSVASPHQGNRADDPDHHPGPHDRGE